MAEAASTAAARAPSVSDGRVEHVDPGSIEPLRRASASAQPNLQHEAEQCIAALRVALARTTPGNPAIQGWRSYSQCDEDGIIRECLRRIASATPLSRTFIEVGCADGLENNTHQLALEGLAGCWIDGDAAKIKFIESQLGSLQTPMLQVLHAFLTLDSIDNVVQDARAFLGTDDVDFLSLDIDGNDTHLMRAALQWVRPKLLCVEYNAKFPPPCRLEMDYDADHRWSGDDYFGASLQSWVDCLEGYQLVSCGLSGANAFFVRRDLAHCFPTHEAQALYQPPRYWLVGHGGGHRSSLRWLKSAVMRQCLERPWIIEARAPNLPHFQFEIHRKLDQYISGDLARDHVWEPFETEVFRRLCSPGDFLLDIGANIGWYSVVASKLIGERGRLMCFEPDPLNHTLLRRNLGRNAAVPLAELRSEAVGETNGTARLYLSDTNLGDHRVFDDGTSRSFLDVPIGNLDTILGGEQRLPDIVKSDTQGSEARMLAGARHLLDAGWRPVMLLEFWPFGLQHAGDEPRAVPDRLEQLGYLMYEVSEANPRLVTLTRCRLQARLSSDIDPASGGFINILAIPGNSPRHVRIADLID
ncbi:FkbM family methyltransferase [Variovorax sp. YR216]|uniref:FkbM family methyltransferase n=1 Tax=Variovorax sp. YR216 TaxID=1882828 RepID=UPI00115FC154|nr:FkbM family methyltransferase [Variovorax sp. YR216]